MKLYQFFKIYKRFDKERGKTLTHYSIRKENLRKVGLCFITGCFIKPLKVIINNIFFGNSAQLLFFDIRMAQEILKAEGS